MRSRSRVADVAPDAPWHGRVLAVCGRDTGGNGFSVSFYGASTNLHSVWDTRIPEARPWPWPRTRMGRGAHEDALVFY